MKKETAAESAIKASAASVREWIIYIGAFLRWGGIAAVIGGVSGIFGAAFHEGIGLATDFRQQHPWILWLLPVAGIVIVAVYKLTGTEGLKTDNIINAVHQGEKLPVLLLPVIFTGTILTHLFGGSAGREGAALQMGGTIGQWIGRKLHLDDRDLRVATLAGMAAFFSAIFGTPLAASIFAVMVISIGILYHVALVPSLIAALSAYFVATALGVKPTHFTIEAPELELMILVRIAALAMLCALVSILFCGIMHFAEKQFSRKIPNVWVRAVIGGLLVAIMTILCGSGSYTCDYNGAGMDIITAAVEEGKAQPLAFLLKLVFTAVTLGAGFKGGEVVPSFFVGATFGCVAAPILGLPAGFGAAIGLVAVFCGVTNCPISSIFLSVELFGAGGILYFAVACCISFMLSGYNGLYSSQMIMYSKRKAKFINQYTNAAATPDKSGCIVDDEKKDQQKVAETK